VINSKTEFGMKLMRVVGATTGVTYVSVPITTGYRGLVLMRELGATKDELRTLYPGQYTERVIGPNEREAQKFANMVRKSGKGGLVINPGDLYVPDWTQRDYMIFWEETIRSFGMEVVLAPGWEYSAGARYEATVSLQSMLKVSDLRGRELSPADLQRIDERARVKLASEGFDQSVVDVYMPWIDFSAASSDTADFGASVEGFSDIIVRHNFEARNRQHEVGGQNPETPPSE